MIRRVESLAEENLETEGEEAQLMDIRPKTFCPTSKDLIYSSLFKSLESSWYNLMRL
jgi:hypothetical protein